MSQSTRFLGLLAAILTVFLAPQVSQAGDPGSAGLLSMRLGVGARAGAMGETGVASAHGASAMYWNPANLAQVRGSHMMLQHMEYFGSFRKESLAVAHQTELGGIGLLFSGFYSDELARTSSEPAGVQQGTFQPYDLVVGLGWGYQLGEVAIGMSGKFIYERIDIHDGSSFAIDLGVSHRARLEGLVLAAAVQNYGQDFTLDQQPFELPFLLRMGASYAAPNGFLSHLQLASELVVPNDGNGRLHAGLEWQVHDFFALRGGHRFAYETWGSTFGFGLNRGNLTIDYAFMDNGNDFDDTHRFALSIGRP